MPIQNRVFAWGLIGGALALCLWHCQFGVDLTDEAAYLLPGFKFYALGDRPFVDEIFAGPKNFGLANFFLARPWIPFSVFWLRVTSVLFFALTLLWVTRRTFGKQFGAIAGFTFFACLTFDVFVLPTWSHNSWVRNLLLLQLGFLLASEKSNARWPALGAGLAAGLMAVIYQPLFAVTLFVTIGLALRTAFDRRHRFDLAISFPFRIYLIGVILPLVVYFALLAHWGIARDWLASLSSTAALSSYGETQGWRKIGSSLLYLIRSREMWFVLIITPLAGIVSGQKNSPRIVRHLAWAISIISVIFFVRRLLQPETPLFMVTNAFVGLGFGSALLYLARHFRKLSPGAVAIAGALGAAVVMSLSSVTGTNAFFWAMPALVVPALGALCQSIEFPRKWETKIGLAPIVLLLIFIDAGSARHQWKHTYFDVAPGETSARLTTPPLHGLRTSARRAWLVEKIGKLVAGRRFVLPYPTLPGALYFGSARSSRDTVFEIEGYIPEALRARSLAKMAESRFPELFIVVKQHPWTWGIPREKAEVSPDLTFADSDRYLRFIACAKDRIVEDLPEFAAYSVNGGKVKSCARENAEGIWLGSNF